MLLFLQRLEADDFKLQCYTEVNANSQRFMGDLNEHVLVKCMSHILVDVQ